VVTPQKCFKRRDGNNPTAADFAADQLFGADQIGDGPWTDADAPARFRNRDCLQVIHLGFVPYDSNCGHKIRPQNVTKCCGNIHNYM
jgi:ribosomal protein L32